MITQHLLSVQRTAGHPDVVLDLNQQWCYTGNFMFTSCCGHRHNMTTPVSQFCSMWINFYPEIFPVGD